MPSVSPEPRSQYGHPCQELHLWQNLFTEIAQNIGRRLLQALQQRLIRFEDAKIGVMREDQILDGVEGVHPLPLRAQYLLQQPQILNGDAQAPGRRFQKLQFFRE